MVHDWTCQYDSWSLLKIAWGLEAIAKPENLRETVRSPLASISPSFRIDFGQSARSLAEAWILTVTEQGGSPAPVDAGSLGSSRRGIFKHGERSIYIYMHTYTWVFQHVQHDCRFV